MKDVSHVRNDLYEYYYEVATCILKECSHKLTFIRPDSLATRLAGAMLDYAIYDSNGGYWSADLEDVIKEMRDKFPEIKPTVISTFCIDYFNAFHDFITSGDDDNDD